MMSPSSSPPRSLSAATGGKSIRPQAASPSLPSRVTATTYPVSHASPASRMAPPSSPKAISAPLRSSAARARAFAPARTASSPSGIAPTPLGTSIASSAHPGASWPRMRRTASTFAGFVDPTTAARKGRGTAATLPDERARATIWGRNGRFSGRYLTRTNPSEVLGNSPAAFHVSTRGEYGMRLMVDLAKHWGQGTVSLHAVAEREDLPEAYLEQLVAALRKAGLVNGKRGAGGGYVLAREPRDITAGDVVRALEGPIEPQICTAEGEAILNCVREPDCGTRAAWLRLQDSIANALDGMTLAELATTTTRERVHV